MVNNNQQPELEKALRHSGFLRDVKMYRVNDYFFELPDKRFWIVDGGIELLFDTGVFSIGWNPQTEAFSFCDKPFLEAFTELPYHLINSENSNRLRDCIGLTVAKTNFKTVDIEVVVDYTMRTETEKRLVEAVLEFQYGQTLQLATIYYELTAQGEAPSNFRYDPGYELLISQQLQQVEKSHDS